MDNKFDTLVLSGGGIKGFAILGAVQSLIDNEKLNDITTYIGTSIGAIIGYLLAIGYTPIEIVVYIHTNKIFGKINNYDLVSLADGTGALSFTFIHELLETLTINKIGKLLTLKKLKEDFGKTLICCTYNMTTCELEYLNPESNPDLPCLTALRMSANLPFVFDRFKYTNSYYIDGGIGDTFPISYAVKNTQNKIIGIYITHDKKMLQDKPEDGLLLYFLRIWQTFYESIISYKIESIEKERCLLIPIKCDNIVANFIDFSIKPTERIDMFSIGYNIAREIIMK